jgi:hypothetical protein
MGNFLIKYLIIKYKKFKNSMSCSFQPRQINDLKKLHTAYYLLLELSGDKRGTTSIPKPQFPISLIQTLDSKIPVLEFKI